ncbi:MAG: amino acid permease [Pseudomonadota bacterium]
MANEQLKRTLTLPQLIFYGVGTMVGAGIYSVIGAAAVEAGAQLWVSFILAGIAAFLTVLSYAELVAMFPNTGAEYNFLKAAFPEQPVFSFMAGYLIAINAAATSATVALAFSGYLGVFWMAPEAITALVLLSVCTVINIAGISQSTWVSIGLICIEVAGLLLLIWTGFTGGEPGTALASGDDWKAGGIFTATALIFFIFIGFEDVANLSEETKDPTRTVPRALLISVLITSALYVLVAFAFIGLSANIDLGNSASPLSDAAGSVAPWRGDALAVAALFATASTALISLISISRMLFGMARSGDMPTLLSRTLPGRKSPWVAALVLFAAACLLLPLGEIKIIASVSSFGVLLVFAAVQVSMIRLRLTEPDKERPFRVPFAIGRIPVLPVVGIIMVVALLTQFEPLVYGVGGGAIVGGLVIYWLFNKSKKKNKNSMK